MSTDKKSIVVSLTNFINNLFHNLGNLFLTNLLFAVPAGLFFAVFWFINNVTGINSYFILFLTVIPVFPFYAGVVQVTSHIVRGEENIAVFSNFTSGVKENFTRFLVHGVIFYLAIFFSYYSILLYSRIGSVNNVFYFFLAISILITVFFLFVFYYVPSMTVTFDISMKHIYKNSALMTFGEFKHNIIATFGLLILFLICATILLCCVVPVAVIIATIILALLVVPSVGSFIINFAVYKQMYDVIVSGEKKSKEINAKLQNRKNGQLFDDFDTEKSNPLEEFDDVNLVETDDADEYIYHNGKMIKRSVLIKLKQESKNTEDN